MNPHIIRIVPSPQAPYTLVSEKLESLGFARYDAPTAEPQPVSENEIWLSNDERSAVHWIVDDLIGVSYLAVRGTDAIALSEQLRIQLPTDSVVKLQLRAIADRDTDALMDTLYRTAVAADSGYDPDAYSLLRWGLNDLDPLVRRVALVAVSITGWTEFAELLAWVSAHDPVEQVRAQAISVCTLLREQTIKTSP
ncbi:hypothetical protein [Streptomyces sp. NPDC056672]|uniref:hypothetical protein n=1 Tax=Streptomyces sp. NPDC056672 TaxID=3345906 RepID=UPI0036B58273